jgi:RND family efflux transporter MFP subunit
VVIAAIAFTLYRNKKKIEKNNQVVDRSHVAIPVTYTEVAYLPVNRQLVLPAVLEPLNEAVISVNAQGKLKTLNIELGSVVKKGQVLGSIDSRLKELNLESTELTLNKLQGDYQRNKELLEGNATTEISVNESKYSYDNTRIQAEQLKQQISDGLVVSPISGVIVKKNLEAGEFVNPGTPIATVVDVTQLKANVKVNETDAYKLKDGQSVSIFCDVFPGEEFGGSIRYVSPRGDESHNYEVEIVLKNSSKVQLKAGTYIRVSFHTESSGDALQIPKVALVEGIKNPYVYVVKDTKAEMRKITVGREIGENIEVLGGLQKGEKVVVSGQINLSEGSIIEVINNK